MCQLSNVIAPSIKPTVCYPVGVPPSSIKAFTSPLSRSHNKLTSMDKPKALHFVSLTIKTHVSPLLWRIKHGFSTDVRQPIEILFLSVSYGDPLVPILCISGDLICDVGNNNHLNTMLKANFIPYGRDFVTHKPTGRFCNGKLATDFTAEYFGFASYPSAYLRQDTKGKNLLIGANFVLAGSGYYDRILQFYARKANANIMSSRGIHLVSAGNNDFIQNYYINPILNGAYMPAQFSNIPVRSYSTFVQDFQNLYGLGVRRIGATTLPPMGCLPAAVTLFGSGSNQCALNRTSQDLQNKLPGLKLVDFDIYQPLLDLVNKPTDTFFESRKACCGTGTIETSMLCNARIVVTCSNATQDVFGDGFHPSEAANQI
ncbi:Triacylglycerol lipase [Bertholletia excelsa]